MEKSKEGNEELKKGVKLFWKIVVCEIERDFHFWGETQ